jgi:hypothetical protein
METPQEQFVIDKKEKRLSVILPLERYERMLEDIHDLAVVAERREEKPISFDEMKQRLEKDDIL